MHKTITQKNIRRVIAAFLVIAAVLPLTLLSGCFGCLGCFKYCVPDTPNNRSAAKWFKENYDYSVLLDSDFPIGEVDENGYTDLFWDAHIREYPSVKFRIKYDRFPGIMSVGSMYVTDFEYAFGTHYLNQFEKNTGIPLFNFNDDYNQWYSFKVTDYYSSRRDITNAVGRVEQFRKFLLVQPVQIPAELCVTYSGVLMPDNPDNPADNITTTGVHPTQFPNNLADNAFKEYISYCVQYQINLEEFTQEEREAAVETMDMNDRFAVIGQDDKRTVYPDLALREYGYGLTFGTIYEVLRRENYPTLAGTSEKFSFTGADGNDYVFSYSFCDIEHEDFYGTAHNSYYYLVNGEPEFTEFYWYDFLLAKQLNKITGLEFEFGLDDQPLSHGE